MARKCVFCGSSPVTSEHVYPGWAARAARAAPKPGFIKTELGVKHERASGTRWQSKMVDVTASRTCKSCNTGWMSKLEDRCKPLLSGPIKGEEQVFAAATDQVSVAAWMLKTAIMFELSLPGHQEGFIPKAHRDYLFQRLQPPPECEIWLARYEPDLTETSFRESHGENYQLAVDHPALGSGEGYVVTLSIGYLIGQVAGYVGPGNIGMQREVGGRPVTDFLAPLWPLGLERLTWPPRVAFSLAGIRALADPRPK